MAAPTRAVQKLQKILANDGPSTHGFKVSVAGQIGGAVHAGKLAFESGLRERMRLLRGLTEADLQEAPDERITLVRSPQEPCPCPFDWLRLLPDFLKRGRLP
jgi:hypothetical protein